MPNARGTIVNIAAPIAPSLAEICSAFTAVCGFGKAWSAPAGLLRVAARVGDCIAKLQGQFSLTSEILGKLTTETVVDVTRMQALFANLSWEPFEDTLRKSAIYYSKIGQTFHNPDE